MIPVRKRFIRKRKPRGRERCWNWQAHTIRGGYGGFNLGSRHVGAHRVAYMLEHGEIPDGKIVLHLCHNPACVSPHHLVAGTHADNARMKIEAGRQGSRERKMNADKVRDLRRLRDAGWTYDALAARFNISYQNARAIALGFTWQSVDTMDGEGD